MHTIERTDLLEEIEVFDAEVHTPEQHPDLVEYIQDPELREQERQGYAQGTTGKGPFGSLAWNMMPEGGDSAFRDQFDRRPYEDAEGFEETRQELGADRVLFAPGLPLFINAIPDQGKQAAYMDAVNRYEQDRFIRDDDTHYGHVLVVPDRPEASAAQLRQFADHPGVISALAPSDTEFPLGHDRYRPLLDALEDVGLPLILHGNPKKTDRFPSAGLKMGSYLEHHTLAHPLPHMRHMASLIGQEVVETHDIDVGFWEAGLSWVQFMMHRMDREIRHYPHDAPGLERRPAEYIREFFFNTQPLEAFGEPEQFGAFLERNGLQDQVIYSSDYPHPDLDPVSTIVDHDGLADEQKVRLLQDNAEQIFEL